MPAVDDVIVVDDVVLILGEKAQAVRAVNGVSFTARRGDFIVLQGASGSGKTSLIRCLAGLAAPTSGRIQLDGAEITDLNEDQRANLRLERVGVIFQEHQLIDEFTVGENVGFPLELRHYSPEDVAAEVREKLEAVGIADLDRRFPGEISGGQKQRAGIARSLVGGRKLLLADEPTGALDSENSVSLFRLFKDLAANHGVTIVMASHDTRATEFATRVLTMVDGRVVLPEGGCSPS